MRQVGETGDTVSNLATSSLLLLPPSSRVSSSRSRVLWQMRILKHSHSLTDCQILNNSAHLLSIFFCLTRREAEMTMFCFEWWNKNYVITKYCLENLFLPSAFCIPSHCHFELQLNLPFSFLFFMQNVMQNLGCEQGECEPSPFL